MIYNFTCMPESECIVYVLEAESSALAGPYPWVNKIPCVKP